MSVFQYTILVVGDSLMLHHTIREVLVERADINIVETRNGREALEELSNHQIDLVITELFMPVMDGLVLIQQIRKDKKDEELPVLVLSAPTDNKKKEEAFRLGATDFIIKPFLPFELVARVSGYLERQRAYRVLKQKNKQMMEELDQAKEIQQTILPHLPVLPNVRMGAKYQALTTVSGDFYDVFDLRHGNLGILIVDVTGHGICAALVSSMIAILFKTHTLNFTSSALTLQVINDLLQSRLPDEKFATIFYGVYNVKDQSLTYTTAGHPPGYVINSETKKISKLSTDNIVLGAFPGNIATFTERTFQFSSGDKLLLYTDGLIEVHNTEGEMFGFNGLENFLIDQSHLEISDLIEAVFQHISSFSDSNFGDDITALGMEIL